MNQAQALYHLQTIDLALEERQNRLQALNEQLGDNSPVLAAETALQAAEQALVPCRTKVRDLELAIKSLSNKAAGAEQRLYGGKVSNPKELQDLQNELASLKRRHAKLEDDLLEAMIAVENGQEICAAASNRLADARQEWQQEQAALAGEKQQVETRLVDLEHQRASALESIETDSLNVYESLRKSKHGIAITLLNEGMCKTCGVSQTTITIQQVRQGHALIHCANCGRILVLN